jgi:hypothetical protein
MINQTIINNYVAFVQGANGFGVLATEGEGLPHASLVAITPMDDFTHLIFATYRNTYKYKNLINNGNVAILFDNRSALSINQPDVSVLTAFGYASEIDVTTSDDIFQNHLLKHPELKTFLLSSNCTLFRVKVSAYQMVSSFDEINWWHLNV